MFLGYNLPNYNMIESKGALLGRPESDLSGARKVVVTGMGMVSPLGHDVESSWGRLIKGESNLTSITFADINASVFGAITDYDSAVVLGRLMKPKEIKKIPRVSEFSTGATLEALTQAGLLNDDQQLIEVIDPERVGVVIGSGYGAASNIAAVDHAMRSGEKIYPSDILRSLVERVSTVPSMAFGLQGPLLTPSAACATGNVSIITGIEKILLGQADIMIVGGAEASLIPPAIKAFDALGALSRESDPTKASRPFDKSRDGFVYGEGAGVLVVETEESAVRRGAEILAYLVGYGQVSDARHATDPDGAKQIRTIEKATEGIRFPMTGTIYVNAHGTATPAGDPIELNSIRHAVADHTDTVVSSTKGATGHTLGAAGAIEAIFCVKALSTGIVPPTVHHDDPIEEAGGIDLVPNKAQRHSPVIAINNSFGFGGINSTVTLYKAH